MEHGKECFKTRRAARQVNNQFHDRHRSVYTCTETGFFHIGGLPTSVVRGSVTRKEIYEDNEEAA
jgi:hypothetical protein